MAEDKDVYEYAYSRGPSTYYERTTLTLEKYLTSLDTYDTVYMNNTTNPCYDPLYEFRMLWHREDLDIVKCQLRNLHDHKADLLEYTRIIDDRSDIVEAVLLKEEACMQFANLALDPELLLSKYRNLKDEHDALRKQKYECIPVIGLQEEFSRLETAESEKRCGLDRPCV
jgi:hypothetical protein